MPNKMIDFTIGADPELTLVEGNKIIESGDYTDEIDQFGSDGNCVTFEVRPEPSKDPLQLVSNIHKIFVNKIYQEPRYMKYKWVAGSFYKGYAMGGHIHFGTRGKIDNSYAVDYLNQYLGPVSILIEDLKQGKSRRELKGYGTLGDYRNQDHGFEYRTPASWLTSPYIAAAMLTLGKTIIHEAINNTSFKYKRYIHSEDFNTSQIDLIQQRFPEIWKDITNMSLYQNYKPYIDIVYHLIKNKLTWFPKITMKESWGLIDTSKFQRNKVDIGTIWSRFQSQQSTKVVFND
jgi:hypothetical protein